MDHFYYPHTVERGETLTSISAKWGWSSPQALILFRRNKGIINQNIIHPGQVIAIPYKKSSLLRWGEHYTEAMRQAKTTMDEYNSVCNQMYRSVRQAFQTVEGWFDNLMDAKGALDGVKLISKLEHLNGKVLEMAQTLLFIRGANTAIAGLDKLLDALNWLGNQISETVGGLKRDPYNDKREELEKVAKALLRHAEMVLEIINGFYRQEGIAKAARNRRVVYGVGLATDRDVGNAALGLAGKTVDHVFLAGKVGFYLGDFLASCTNKADFGLFFYGFSEYDEKVGKELEKIMLRNVESAQLRLSQIRMQLQSNVYSYATS